MHPKGSSNPNVSIHQRLTEFPGESFKESAGTLFCTGCREEVGLKMTIIQQHSRGKEKLAVKESREQDIANVFKGYDNENHPKGETLSMAQRVYRFKVVRTFLKAGVAINKIDQFREIFEEQGYSLSHSSNLSSMIDVINKEEKDGLYVHLKSNLYLSHLIQKKQLVMIRYRQEHCGMVPMLLLIRYLFLSTRLLTLALCRMLGSWPKSAPFSKRTILMTNLTIGQCRF